VAFPGQLIRVTEERTDQICWLPPFGDSLWLFGSDLHDAL
jgi:hypothetical protein